MRKISLIPVRPASLVDQSASVWATKECRMNIYIGNLSSDTTEDQLRDAFTGFGAVATVNIIKDKTSGDPRGFAFVEMSAKNEATAAISGLDGHDLNGRSLKVSEAKSHAETGNRSGGNGYRKLY